MLTNEIYPEVRLLCLPGDTRWYAPDPVWQLWDPGDGNGTHGVGLAVKGGQNHWKSLVIEHHWWTYDCTPTGWLIYG